MRLLDDRARCPEELRDFTWRYIRGQSLVTEQVVGVHQGGSGTPPVVRVAHSPVDTLVATVSGLDPQVRVYDVQTRRLLFVLTGHQSAVHGVAFAPDGKSVATAGSDNTVRIWVLPTGRPAQPAQLAPRATLTGHTNTVQAVTFSPDGTRLASAGADGLVRLWDLLPMANDKEGKPTAAGVLKQHVGTVWSVAWAPDSLFSAGSVGRVLLWRLQPGGAKWEDVLKLKKQALALSVTPDGELLAAAGDAELDEDEPVIHLYRPLTDRKAGQLRGHTGLGVYDLSFAPDGKRLASAGRDGTVRVWDVAGLQEKAVFRPEKEPRPSATDATVRAFRAAVFAPDGLSVISGGQDGVVRQWNFAGQKKKRSSSILRPPLSAATVSSDGQVLAVAERVFNQVKVWRFGDPAGEAESERDHFARHRSSGIRFGGERGQLGRGGRDAERGLRGGPARRAGMSSRHKSRKAAAVSLAARGSDLVMATDEGQLEWINVRTRKRGFHLPTAENPRWSHSARGGAADFGRQPRRCRSGML